MATKIWTNGGVDHNWSTAGNWLDGSKPATGDDVVMAVAWDCVINEATAALKSFDQTGYANVLSGTFDITVTVSSGTVNCLFANGASHTWSGILKLNPAAGTTINFTSGGMTTCGGVTIAGTTTGRVNMVDALYLAATKIVTLTSGTLHTDGTADNSGLSHSWGKYATATGTKVLYLGNSTITITGTSTPWSHSTTNATLYEGTSTIILNGAGITFSGGTETYYDVQFTGSGTAIITSATTFTNLTRTGTAAATDALQFSGTQTVTGSLTINGNSGVNRVLVTSNTIGTARSMVLTGATVTCNNVDFRDITFTYGANLDLTNSGANNIGDLGGVTLAGGYTLSLTPVTTWYWKTSSGGTYSMQDYQYWFTQTNGGGTQMPSTRVPVPQDNLKFNSDSVTGTTTVSNNSLRVCADVDCTGVNAMTLNLNVLSETFYGSMTLSSNVTMSIASRTITFAKRGTAYLTSAGKNFGAFVSSCYSGSLVLLDNLNIAYNIVIGSGTFDANDNAVTASRIDTSTGISLYMGNGNWYISGTYSNETFRWSGGTLYCEGSTLNMSTTGSSAVVLFATAQSLTFNNLTIYSGAGITTINGNGIFNVVTINSTAAKTVKFTAGSTTTVNSLVATGTSSNHITIASSLAGTPYILTDANGGTNENDYLFVTDCSGTPATTWFYGANGSGDTYSNSNGWASVNSGGVAVGFMTCSKYWGT